MDWGRHRGLLKAGSHAPDFRLARLDGGETSLREALANGPALLAFFKVNCPVCRLTFPFLERIHFPGKLSIWGVSQNSPADTRAFAGEYGVTFPILLDSEQNGYPASNAYGISSVPTLFLVERDGTVSKVIPGWSKGDVAEIGGAAGVNPFLASESVPEWKAG
jgi:peroxiredoxin